MGKITDPVITLVTPGEKPQMITKTKSHELLTTAGGRIFTALFIDKDGEPRKINCQYLKNQSESPLGYIKVREMSRLKANSIKAKEAEQSGEEPELESSIRSINLQTLREFKLKGVVYKVK